MGISHAELCFPPHTATTQPSSMWCPALLQVTIAILAGSAKCPLNSGYIAMPDLVPMMGIECSSKFSPWVWSQNVIL